MAIRVEVVKDFDLSRFPDIFREEAERGMRVVTDRVTGEGQKNSPVHLGAFKASLAPVVTTTARGVIEGTITSPLIYARVIEGVDASGNPQEYGRRPGAKQPPIAALLPWVQRKFGLQGAAARSVAFLVARSIARDGVKAVRPVGRAVEALSAFADDIFLVRIPDAIIAKL